ncbi:MAG: hypothetical protein JST48_05540 [Bacteroidetes bacterium]|nr:hypothetical protein [Bacteroidota bacterium]
MSSESQGLEIAWAAGETPPGYLLQAPSAIKRAEFIPSAASGGFSLLSLPLTNSKNELVSVTKILE